MLYTIMFVVLFLYFIAGVHGGGDGGGGERQWEIAFHPWLVASR